MLRGDATHVTWVKLAWYLEPTIHKSQTHSRSVELSHWLAMARPECVRRAASSGPASSGTQGHVSAEHQRIIKPMPTTALEITTSLALSPLSLSGPHTVKWQPAGLTPLIPATLNMARPRPVKKALEDL